MRPRRGSVAWGRLFVPAGVQRRRRAGLTRRMRFLPLPILPYGFSVPKVYFTAPRPSWLVLGAYVGAGLVPAIMVNGLLWVGRNSGLSYGAFAWMHLAVPACIFAVALWYPSIRHVLIGGVIAFASFTLCYAIVQDWRFWGWTYQFLVRMPYSVAGIAFGVSTLVGVAIADVRKDVRCIGYDPAVRCATCGYLWAGLDRIRCPECGAEQRAKPPMRP